MAIGAAVTAVAGIGGTALAHESSAVGDTFVGDFARHLGVSPAKVRAAYRATMVDRIEAAVKAGRLTRAQAGAIERRIRSHTGGPFGFGASGGFEHRHFDHGGPFEHHGPSPLDGAANYLGISADELRRALFSGSTPVRLAIADGKSVSGIETAMLAPLRERLAAGVTAGRLTNDRSARILADVTARLDSLVRHGFQHDLHPQHSGRP
jgi:hypothetical protein